MDQCVRCKSMAINHQCHGRDGSEPELCDVCYWRKKAEAPSLDKLYGDYLMALELAERIQLEANDAMARADEIKEDLYALGTARGIYITLAEERRD